MPMATTTPSSSLRLSNLFLVLPPKAKAKAKPSLLRFRTRSTNTPTPPSDSEPDPSQPESPNSTSDSADEAFENRVNQLRLRYRSGTGKKAELRKVRKSGKKGTSSGSGVYLPPVPLKEPVSGALKVDFGFSSYSERLNGRIAFLGLSALLLVELATGKSVINYHTPAIVLIQIYFVAAVSALYVKYEKEKISVWPSSLNQSK